jgi:hypothetical protein
VEEKRPFEKSNHIANPQWQIYKIPKNTIVKLSTNLK